PRWHWERFAPRSPRRHANGTRRPLRRPRGIVVTGCHGHRANRFAVQPLERSPGLAAVIGAKNIALLVIEDAPCGSENGIGVGRIKDDMVQHIIVTGSEMRK